MATVTLYNAGIQRIADAGVAPGSRIYKVLLVKGDHIAGRLVHGPVS